MHLNPNAIELVLERRRTELRKRLLHIRGRLRQHRLDGAKELDREALQITLGDGAEVAGQHHRTPHVACGQLARLGERFDHDSFERALAQLTSQQANEKVLFFGGRL